MTITGPEAGQVFLRRDRFNRLTRAHDCISDSSCARLIGTHRKTISRLRAQTGSPSGAVMFQIAQSLGVDVEFLFTTDKEQS